MERVNERCCALDVHKAQVTACVHVPDQQGKRSELCAEFSTMTTIVFADHLASCGERIAAALSRRAMRPGESPERTSVKICFTIADVAGSMVSTPPFSSASTCLP